MNKGGTLIDIEGQTYSFLKVTNQHKLVKSGKTSPKSKPYRDTYWLCICECGNKKWIKSINIRKGLTKSCGKCNLISRGGPIRHQRKEDTLTLEIGNTYKDFKIIDYKTKDDGRVFFYCECICGNKKWVGEKAVTGEKAKGHCGCKNKIIKPKLTPSPNHFLPKGFIIGKIELLNTLKVDKKYVTYKCFCNVCEKEFIRNTLFLLKEGRIDCGCTNKLNLTAEERKYKERIRYREKRRIKKHKFIGDIELWNPTLEKHINEFFSCCVLCYSKENLTVDHLIPLLPEDGSTGFPLQPGNALILCQKCNSKKKNKILNNLPPIQRFKLLMAAESFKRSAVKEGLININFRPVQGSWEDTYTFTERTYKYILSSEEIIEIYNRVKSGESAGKIGIEKNIGRRTIYSIATCKYHKCKELGLEPLTPPYSNRYKFSKNGKRIYLPRKIDPVNWKYKIPNETILRAYNRVASGERSLTRISFEEGISAAYLKLLCRRECKRAVSLNLSPLQVGKWYRKSRNSWSEEEERILIDNFKASTMKELRKLLPLRTPKAINRRIDILRSRGLVGYKSKAAVVRAYKQR